MKGICQFFSIRPAIAAAFAATLCSVAWGKSFRLDLRATASGGAVPSRRAASAARPGADGTLRSFGLAAGATDIGAVAVGDEIEFALFDDVSITLTLKEKMPTPLGGDAFLAEATGYNGVRNAVVLRTADGLTADVQDYHNGRVYRVVSSPSGVTVGEIAPEGESLCGNDAMDPLHAAPRHYDSAGAGTPAASRTVSAASAAADADTCVDILVAYDENAASWANANGGGTTNFAQVAVQKMNAALANTGLSSSFRFRLVGVIKVDVSADNVHEALYAIDDGAPGWADIRDFREQVGADIVTTLVDTGSAYGTTGAGWSLLYTSSLSTFGESAYNVCAVRSVAQSHTMTHECGHNMGAGHATLQATQPGPQLYSYSAAHYFTGTDGSKYCTIMAYASEGPGGTQIPYFSSPSHSYAGEAVGDSTHDNTRTLANTFSYVSNWRSQKVPTSYAISFSPESGTLIDGSISVTLTPGKPGTAIRYTLDGSDPTPASPLYTGPILITRETTIKASTFVDGACSIPYTAFYYMRDGIGAALDAPHLVWTTEGNYPWTVLWTDTYEGASALQSAQCNPGASGVISELKTTVTGPITMNFRYKARMYMSRFTVVVDGDATLVATDSVSDWTLAAVEIPEGEHQVVFSYEKGGWYESGFNGVYLDSVRFGDISPTPTLSPATTDNEDTAQVFTGAMTVSLSAPEDCAIYYTLDGSDPTSRSIRYDGPFSVTATTRVRAISIRDGCDASVVVSGLYLERHPIQAGEWTTDVEGAKKAALTNGSIIVTLLGNYETCEHTRAFAAVAESAEFLSWAKANGVYLITADSSRWIDTGAAYERFWNLFYDAGLSGSTYYPALAIANAWEPDVATGYALARSGNGVGDVRYAGTVATLEAGLASFISVRPSVNYVWVEFNGNGGTPYEKSRVGIAGQAIGDLPQAYRDYHYFDEWYTAADGGAQITSETVLTGDSVFYAHWTPFSYYVRFNANGGSVSPSYKYVSYGMAYGDLPTPMFTAAGAQYYFEGWYTAASGGKRVTSSTKVEITSSQTLYAHWRTVESYIVSYMPGALGSGAQQTATKLRDVPLALKGALFTRSGYTQTGWSESDGGAKAYDLSASYTANESTTLYPFWTANACAVTLDWQGGTGGSASITATYGAAMPSITVPTRTGYAFGGYYTAASGGGTQYYTAAGTPIRNWDKVSDMTLYAKWTANTYAVTLDRQDGTGGTASVTATFGSAMPPITPPERDGHAFGGYFTAANGGGTQYYKADGTCAKDWDKPCATTLYAFWEEAVPSSVHRFYSKNYKGHFFTINEAEKDDLIANNPNWRYENVAYRAYPEKAAGTVALHRFYSKNYRGHFFTINEEEAENIKRTNTKNWKYEGVAYYVYPSAVEGSVPVYRFWSKRYRHHFYTIDEAEKDNLIATNPNWKFEGEAFWALPAPETGDGNDKNDGNDGKDRNETCDGNVTCDIIDMNDKNDGKDRNETCDGNATCDIIGMNDKNDGKDRNETCDGNATCDIIGMNDKNDGKDRNDGNAVAPWTLVTWPDFALVATDGETEIEGVTIETRGVRHDACDLVEIVSHAEDAEIDLLLALPNGAWRATLWSVTDGTAYDEDATAVFGFTLPANGVWHWLDVRDAADEESFSLWLLAE